MPKERDWAQCGFCMGFFEVIKPMNPNKYCSTNCRSYEASWNPSIKKGFTKGHPSYLKQHTPETKRLMSINRQGRNIGQVPWCDGKQFSEEHKQALSNAHKEHWNGVAYWKGKRMPIEIRNKMKAVARRGSASPLWRGGITTLNNKIRTCAESREWRKDVFKRDSFTCVSCGQIGGALEADHIKPFSMILKENKIRTLSGALDCEELWDIFNGRTLCLECHKKTSTYKRGVLMI